MVGSSSEPVPQTGGIRRDGRARYRKPVGPTRTEMTLHVGGHRSPFGLRTVTGTGLRSSDTIAPLSRTTTFTSTTLEAGTISVKPRPPACTRTQVSPTHTSMVWFGRKPADSTWSPFWQPANVQFLPFSSLQLVAPANASATANPATSTALLMSRCSRSSHPSRPRVATSGFKSPRSTPGWYAGQRHPHRTALGNPDTLNSRDNMCSSAGSAALLAPVQAGNGYF